MAGVEGIGERIRRARLAAKVRQDELERRCGLVSSSLSKIESGKRAVKADELALIAEALGVSPLGLLEPASFVGSLASAAPGTEGMAAAGSVCSQLVRLAELHQVLADDGIVAAPAIADAPRGEGDGWLTAAVELAVWARGRIGGFAPTLFGLAEAVEAGLGVDVMVADVGGTPAAAIVAEEFPFVLVGADQHPRRALFALAHALGLVLAAVSPGIVEVPDRCSRGGELARDANAFAAALLMPEPELRAVLGEHGLNADGFAVLLRRFGVSFEALAYRLHNLGVIDAAGRRGLLESGWGGLLRDVSDPGLRGFLAAEMGRRAGRRPPGLLCDRVWRGMLAGSVSVRPFAALAAVDAEVLAAQLEQPEVAAVPLSCAAEPAEVRFGGDPL